MDDTPRRACRFVLDLEADTRDDLATALFNITSQIERGELSQGVSGGYPSGYIYELSENDRPTHTEWAAQLRAYLDAKKAPPDGAPTAATPASTPGNPAAPHTDHPSRHWDRTCPACVAEAPAPNIYEQRLRAVLDVVQRYLPPDGIDQDVAMSEIIGLVDPWLASTTGSAVVPADEAPLSRCTACGRKSWDAEEAGQLCAMPQPGGEFCHGTMVAAGPASGAKGGSCTKGCADQQDCDLSCHRGTALGEGAKHG